VLQNHERFDPVHHVNKWKMPMFVIQGDLDFRIPTAQVLSTFTALQRKGIDSQLLGFPDENHCVLKPASSLQWRHTVINWLDPHLNKSKVAKTRKPPEGGFHVDAVKITSVLLLPVRCFSRPALLQ